MLSPVVVWLATKFLPATNATFEPALIVAFALLSAVFTTCLSLFSTRAVQNELLIASFTVSTVANLPLSESATVTLPASSPSTLAAVTLPLTLSITFFASTSTETVVVSTPFSSRSVLTLTTVPSPSAKLTTSFGVTFSVSDTLSELVLPSKVDLPFC